VGGGNSGWPPAPSAWVNLIRLLGEKRDLVWGGGEEGAYGGKGVLAGWSNQTNSDNGPVVSLSRGRLLAGEEKGDTRINVVAQP